MKLSKFFRRYSRILLMFFMSLLLVVFLLGDVLQNWQKRFGPQNVKVGQAFGKDVYASDLYNARARRDRIRTLGTPANTSIDEMQDDPLGVSVLARMDDLHFYLLVEEARRLGVRVDPEQVKAVLTAVHHGTAGAERVLGFLQDHCRKSAAEIMDEAGTWLAVMQLLSLQGDALGDSLPRVELAYRNQRQEAQTQISIIDAKALVACVPEPTEDELQAFFEEGKNRDTAHTEDELVFGYVRPDRVQIEYLTADPRRMEPRVRVKDKEAQAWFDEHADQYQKVLPQTQPATQPARPVTVPMTYEEARERVRQDVRVSKAIKETQDLIYEIRHEAYQPWQLLPRDEAGFRTAPPAEALTPFESLRDKYADRGETIVVKTEMLSRAELSRLFDPTPDQLRRGMRTLEPAYREGATVTTLSEMALRVKGLYTPVPKDPRPLLNLLEPSPVLISGKQDQTSQSPEPYQAYLFRVLAVSPKGPPDSLAEVRAKLVEDYKLKKAHEMAGQYARQLAEQARSSGLVAAVDAVPELKERLATAERAFELVGPDVPPVPLDKQYLQMLGPSERATTRMGSIRELGSSRKLQREIFAVAAAAATQPEATHLVAVVEVANAFKWAVAEIESVKPLYAGEFEQRQASLWQQSRRQDQYRLALGWISAESIRLRSGWTPAAGFEHAESIEP